MCQRGEGGGCECMWVHNEDGVGILLGEGCYSGESYVVSEVHSK